MPRRDRETKLTFAALSRRSNQVANFLRGLGLKRGDHLLLLLGNVVPLWETMLAAMKLGIVVIPATTLLTPDELAIASSEDAPRSSWPTQHQIAKCATLGGELVRIVVGARSKHDGWLPYEQAADVSGDIQGRWAHPRRRSAAALFHLGHDGQAETGAAQPTQLSGWRVVDDVLARAAAGRCASQYFFAGLGQARLELLVRAVECRRHRVRGQPAAVQCQGAAGDDRPLRRHHPLRAADGVAAAHPGEAGRPSRCRCAKSAAPASRSIPRSSSRCKPPGG